MKEPDRQNIEELYKAVCRSSHTVITSHIRPDGDAMGSCLAMMRYIRSLGGSADIVLPDRFPQSLGFMTGNQEAGHIISAEDDFGRASELFRQADLAICLDFNRLAENRCGKLAPLLEGFNGKRILIDHHLAPELERFSLAFTETEISSASELLFWILNEMPGTDRDARKLPAGVPEALFTGMTTDTNNFSNSSSERWYCFRSRSTSLGSVDPYIPHPLFPRLPSALHTDIWSIYHEAMRPVAPALVGTLPRRILGFLRRGR